ncbi:MAG: proprotein convertase P-domain-containing protein [Pseudomonadota bacterium]
MKKTLLALMSATFFCTSAQAITINSPNVPITIFDNTSVTSTLDFTSHFIITDVNLTMNLTHTWDADLDIFLAHGGTEVELTSDNGGSGNDYTNTTFDDEASTAITAGTAPFTGFFRPEQLLSVFDGMDAFGTWTLKIRDDQSGDSGTLHSWSLAISGRSTQENTNTVSEPALLGLLGVGLFGLFSSRHFIRTV